MEKLLIIGAGGHGRVVADIAMKMNRWQRIAFLDDDDAQQYSLGLEVIGPSSKALNLVEEYDIFVAIGNNATREKLHKVLKAAGVTMPTLIHPSATIGRQVKIGEGTVVMAGAVINCCSRIGDGCIVNTAATVGHDGTIADYVHISSGAHIAGTVTIGKGTWIGIGVIVKNNVQITEGTFVGAGAVVIRNIVEAATYVGVPVRRINTIGENTGINQ